MPYTAPPLSCAAFFVKVQGTENRKQESLFTIRDHLFPEKAENKPKGYSLASAPAPVPIPSFTVTVSGDSDFLRAVSSKNGEEAWDVIDGLMDTLKSVNPRVYDSVMQKIRAL